MPNLDRTTFSPRPSVVRKDEYFRMAGHPSDGKLLAFSTTTSMVNSAWSERRQRTSTTTRNYRQLLQRRLTLLPENSYQFILTKDSGTFNSGPVLWYEPVAYGLNVYTNTGMSQWIVNPPSTYLDSTAAAKANLRDKTVNKILLKIKDQKVNLAQAYAERAQTARLVGDTVTRIAKALTALKSGNIVSAAAALGVAPTRRMKNRGVSQKKVTEDFVSKSWLELQYGWKPLLNDVVGAAETLAALNFRQQLNHVVTTQSLNDHDITVRKVGSEYVETVERTLEIQYKYGIWFSVGDTAVQSAASLGLTNPALIAWELLPWSFVIDWFVPIGNYISSWDATLGCDFQQGYATEVVKRRQIVTRQYSGTPATGGYAGQTRRILEDVTITRDKLIAFPSSRPPSFKNPLSVDHALNALALLTQLRK